MSPKSPSYSITTLFYSIAAVLAGAAAITVLPMAFGGDFFNLQDKNEDGVLSGSIASKPIS